MTQEESQFHEGMDNRNYKHGMSNTKLFFVWFNIKERCNNPKNGNYIRYGGKGIAVCDEWLEFLPFYTWSVENGYSEGLEIDRIDPLGNYEPSNCRWTDHCVNNQNKPLRSYKNKTGYVGVSKHGKKYRVQIKAFKKSYRIGKFITPEEAALAYNEMVIKNGWNHPLNIIKSF